MKCKLITTVSDPLHPGWLTLNRSLDKFGWDYEICGTSYEQFGSKMVNAYNYAKTTDCTHLFIVDAYDVLCYGTMISALEAIQSSDLILFNAEKNAWPYGQWAMLYPECETDYKYLNGGMAFVEVEKFCRMFEENPITIHDNDQVILAKTYLTRREKYKMSLDTNCNVFQTLCSTNWDEFDFSDGKIKNISTGTYPIFFHGNGLHPMDKLIELI